MNAREIVQALGGRNGLARCPAHNDRTPSLSVRDGADGVLLTCFSGCDRRDVIAALRDLGLWPERDERPVQQRRRATAPRPAPRPAPTFYRHTDDAPETTQRACEIWRASAPLWQPEAEPARRYLASRGIPEPWPETLAYARLPHPETGEADVPTLIVARHCPVVGMVRGIQRIFLTDDGRKYEHGTVKMSLGSIDGGRAELIFAYPLVEVAIAEGVETALSAHRIFGLPAWAMCGGFPAEIRLPASVERVLLVADHDGHGVSERRARALASSIRADGRSCTVVTPEALGKDANDVLQGAA